MEKKYFVTFTRKGGLWADGETPQAALEAASAAPEDEIKWDDDYIPTSCETAEEILATPTGKSRRVFISGPITGTDDYMQRFAEAEQILLEKGYIPVNPTKISALGIEADFSWTEFMAMTLCLLDQCSCIYMLDGWENSRGALLEHSFAKERGYCFVKEET